MTPPPGAWQPVKARDRPLRATEPEPTAAPAPEPEPEPEVREPEVREPEIIVTDTTEPVVVDDTTPPGTNGDALRSLTNLPGVARPPGGIGILIVRGSAPQDTSVFIVPPEV